MLSLSFPKGPLSFVNSWTKLPIITLLLWEESTISAFKLKLYSSLGNSSLLGVKYTLRSSPASSLTGDVEISKFLALYNNVELPWYLT